jgi:hypothetical protein
LKRLEAERRGFHGDLNCRVPMTADLIRRIGEYSAVDRAVMCGWVSVCAVGSSDFVGFFYSSSTLYESPEGAFSTTPCTP